MFRKIFVEIFVHFGEVSKIVLFSIRLTQKTFDISIKKIQNKSQFLRKNVDKFILSLIKLKFFIKSYMR